MSEFRQRIDNHDLIGIAETWGNDSVDDAEIAVVGFNMFRLDRVGSKGGGLALYVRNNLEATLNNSLTGAHFKESIWCNISLLKGKLLVGLCYRSPSSSDQNDEDLRELLELAYREMDGDTHLLIMGDFNYPGIDYSTETTKDGDTAASTKFLYKTQDLCLTQNVMEHTRFRINQKPSKLDYVFTDEEDLIDEMIYGAPLGKSDHATLEWNITLRTKEIIRQHERLNYWKGDYVEISAELKRVKWNELMIGKSVDEMWTCFKTIIIDLTTRYVPIKDDRRKKKGRWLSRKTIKKMKVRNKLWKKYRRYPSGRNHEEYRVCRNEVNKMIREDEDQERKKILKNFRGKPKSFYGYMRNLQTVKDNVTVLMKDDGEMTTTDQEAADILGEYFREVFTKEDTDNMPNIDEMDLDWHDVDVELGIRAVERRLKKLSADKSPGPDGIHPMLLKECALEVSLPLSLIFRKSFETNTLPDDWRTANVVPIYKKGTRTNRANYRPVSLTSVPCKIMESMIKEGMLKHLEVNSVVTNAQHGFMSSRSCLTNLLEALENWTKALDDGYGIDIVYLDFRKAFDSVPHQRLLAKLKGYGITGKVWEWIESFLTTRTMRVGVRNTFSKWFDVTSGVPQGSVLGPLLFLLFVNDLPQWITTNIRMFADDTKLWHKISSSLDSQQLQKDLDNLENWSSIWQLKFNPTKCKVMHVGHNEDTRYYITNGSYREELESVEEETDLGVHFTRDLKVRKQCLKSARKARKIIGLVRRHFRRMDKQDFLLIYKTYIRPHLEYCVQAWSPHLVKDIKCLERVQRSATKLVPSLMKHSYEERLQTLGLTTLQRRRERGDMIEVYKLLTGREKIEKKQFFHLADSNYRLRGHSLKLRQERSRLDIRKYSFSQRVVKMWNSLPQNVVDAETVNGFKNALDEYWKDMDNTSSIA